MEIENLIEELNSRKKNHPFTQNKTLINILRRIKKGWWRVLLIIVSCLIAAWILYIPLKKVHFAKTKMGVMFNKEREANSKGNVSNEIVGGITGWTTTTNKYDEMAILTSHIVVGGMLQQTGYLENAYLKYVKDVGHRLTSKDSIKFVNEYVESFLKRVEVTYTQSTINIKTSIITLSMNGQTEECGPLLIGLVESYNQYTRAYNYQQYENTLCFLNHCIDSLRHDLNKIDEQDQNFRENNLIVDFSQQTDEYLNIDRTMEDDLRNMNLQIQLLSIIRNYMTDMGKDYKVVPANTGIDDAQINRIVIQFNDLVMRRSNFLTSMGEDAMRVKTITNQIEDQRQALIISIDKLTQSFNIRKAKYIKDLQDSNERLKKTPYKRITLDQIERERNIKLPLYKMLQEKYTETLIAKSAEQDQARIVTYPYTENKTLFESPKNLYLLALLLGILISILYLWRMRLPARQVTMAEALQICELPCWSVLPQEDKDELYQTAMEALLSRIRIAGAKTIAVTCSYSHEEVGNLAEFLAKLLEEQGENVRYIKWSSENNMLLSKQIVKYDKANGYLVINCGSYHSNPEIAYISQLVDITLLNVVMTVSKLKSIDFINYANKEGVIKEGALVLTNASIDKKNQVTFGTFDYTPPTGLAALAASMQS